MRIRFLFSALIIMPYLNCIGQGQTDIYQSFVGEWYQKLSSGDTLRYFFNSDRTVYMTDHLGNITGKGKSLMPNGTEGSLLIKYILYEKETPMRIDLVFAINDFYNVVGRAEGIVKILDEDLMLVAMNFGKPIPSRPTNFSNPNEAGLFVRNGAKSKNQNCQKFKNGKFEIYDVFAGTTKIERIDDVQFETNELLGGTVKLKVDWIDDCTYTLKPNELVGSSTWLTDTTGLKLTVTIMKTLENSYIQNAHINKSNHNLTKEVVMVK